MPDRDADWGADRGNYADEIDAMKVAAAALEPLTEDQQKRVMDYLEDRFIDSGKRLLRSTVTEKLRAEMETVAELAKKFGVTEREVMQAAAFVRDRKRLAPVSESDVTEDEVRDALGKRS